MTMTPTQIPRPIAASGHSGGFTLIEVLIALLVLSVGLLGIAGLQLTSLRSNHSAYLRSQATIMAYDMLDRMRANRAQAQAGNYNKTGTTKIDDASDLPAISGTPTQADIDLNQWGTALLALLPGAQADINLNANNIVTVSISWDDSRADRADDRSGTAVTNATQFQFQTEF